MFDKFTDRARKIIALAQKEAERFHHDYIGTEHLLLGLVKEGSGVAVTALNNLNVDVDKVRREVEKLVVVNDKEAPTAPLPFTPQAKRVLELASEEARALGHPYIGTEHILLGLLSENDSVAAQVLINLDLKLEDVRNEILDLLGASDVSSMPGDKAGEKGTTGEKSARPASGRSSAAAPRTTPSCSVSRAWARPRSSRASLSASSAATSPRGSRTSVSWGSTWAH